MHLAGGSMQLPFRLVEIDRGSYAGLALKHGSAAVWKLSKAKQSKDTAAAQLSSAHRSCTDDSQQAALICLWLLQRADELRTGWVAQRRERRGGGRLKRAQETAC